MTDLKKIAFCGRTEWSIESCHNALDVVFGEDTNETTRGMGVEQLQGLRKTCDDFACVLKK
jgi:hypothetical protein